MRFFAAATLIVMMNVNLGVNSVLKERHKMSSATTNNERYFRIVIY